MMAETGLVPVEQALEHFILGGAQVRDTQTARHSEGSLCASISLVLVIEQVEATRRIINRAPTHIGT